MEKRITYRKWVSGVARANGYLLYDIQTHEGIIIDPGVNPSYPIRIIEKLRLREIKGIILTHGHIDHIRATKVLKKFYGAPVMIHEEDLKIYLNPLRNFSILFFKPCKPPYPDIFLKDGDKITMGNQEFAVFHTPGHTRGSICIYGAGLLFTGDSLLYRSVGNLWIPGASKSTLLVSLRTKIINLPDDTIVLPGHGRTSKLKVLKKVNPILKEVLNIPLQI